MRDRALRSVEWKTWGFPGLRLVVYVCLWCVCDCKTNLLSLLIPGMESAQRVSEGTVLTLPYAVVSPSPGVCPASALPAAHAQLTCVLEPTPRLPSPLPPLAHRRLLSARGAGWCGDGEGRCHCSHWIRVVDMSLQASFLWEHPSMLSIRCLSDRDCGMLPCGRGPRTRVGAAARAVVCVSCGQACFCARREKRWSSAGFRLMP